MQSDLSAEMQTVQTLITALGKVSFTSAFLTECSRLSGADQIAVFGIRGGSAECLLAYRSGIGDQALALCRQYIRQFIDRDSFLGTGLRAHSPYSAAVVKSSDIRDFTYRRRLFQEAGLQGKIAAISCGACAHFYLNMYYGDLGSEAFRRGVVGICKMGPVLLELWRKHHLLIDSGWSAPDGRVQAEAYLRDHLDCLSEREVQVCARILCGRATEAIAEELGVSVPTVKTFRKRAYAKLSVRSQGELFARCAGLLAH